MQEHALLVIKQVAQRIVDRKHRRRHIPHSRAMLLGQPIENLANVAFCLGAVLFELGEALYGIYPAFETPCPTGREVELIRVSVSQMYECMESTCGLRRA